MGAHLVLIEGGLTFQSDKYPTCPPGKVPLSVKDPTAQDLLAEYARRRRVVDAEFSTDLEEALRLSGYKQGDRPPALMVLDLFAAARAFVQGSRRPEAMDENYERLRQMVEQLASLGYGGT
jgi:hypothetical protein